MAKVVLERILGYPELSLEERPDLRDRMSNTGIEVTTANGERYEVAHKLWLEKLNGRSKSVGKKDADKEISNKGYEVCGKMLMGEAREVSQNPLEREGCIELFRAISKKTKLLNNGNYDSRCDDFELFVISEILESSDIAHTAFIKKVKRTAASCGSRQYSKIHVMCIDAVVTFKEDTFQCYPYSIEETRHMGEKAKQLCEA